MNDDTNVSGDDGLRRIAVTLRPGRTEARLRYAPMRPRPKAESTNVSISEKRRAKA